MKPSSNLRVVQPAAVIPLDSTLVPLGAARVAREAIKQGWLVRATYALAADDVETTTVASVVLRMAYRQHAPHREIAATWVDGKFFSALHRQDPDVVPTRGNATRLRGWLAGAS